MAKNVDVFMEGQKYKSSDYPEIVRMLKKNTSVIAIKGDQFSFRITGFLICNNIPLVIFPKNFITDETTFRFDANILLRTLLRYRTETIHPKEENAFLNGNDLNSNGRIVSAIALLNDFQNNDFLSRNEKIKTVKDKGNIDWHSTINTTIPVLHHGRPIYSNPVIKRTAIDANHIVILIHKAVISECARLWGWMTGVNNDELLFELPCSVEEAIRHLTSELTLTYINRELEVIRNMIAYLKCKTGRNTLEHIEILATPFFYYVWEYICGHIFENQYSSLSGVVPQPVWKNNLAFGKISQRPDILFINDNCFFILDAKYYNYHHSLPGWHDAAKQLFYQYTVENNQSPEAKRTLLKINKICNAFIMPETGEMNVRYLGFIEVENVGGLNKIQAFAINSRQAMQAYAGGIKSDLKDCVISQLATM